MQFAALFDTIAVLQKETSMKNNKNRKKQTGLFCVLAVLLALMAIFTVLALVFPGRIYPHLRALLAHFPSGMPVETQIETKVFDLEELRADERVTFSDTLLLVNADHPLTSDRENTVIAYKGTDVRMAPELVSAYAALSGEVEKINGRKLYISSAFRTAEEQQEAIDEEGDIAARLGESEHQAGLALDVYIKYFGGSAFLKTKEGRWVNSHCSEYGFIIRYPYGKSEITGISYEPWHLRYLGEPHAEIVEKNYITLEEYIDFLKEGKFYIWEDTIITRQAGDSPVLPALFLFLHVSEDNTGHRIYTAKLP